MRFSLITVTFTFLLLITLAVSAWSFFLSDHPHVAIPAQALANQPDAYMEEVSAVILSELGKPVLRIESPRMTHYPKNDTTRIQMPHVTFYRNSPEPWYVNAEQGIATHGIQNILFKTHVFVRHAADNVNPDILLKTESLSILPDRKEANTTDEVTITQPDATIRATGMSANLNTGIIHLLADTRSEYVPDS